MKFTTSQIQAIEHGTGACLVLAVPGAGKTTVLLKRLENLIASGVDPRKIASITFSKQQAVDMQKRFLAKVEDDPAYENYQANDLTFSTIHAFCYRIIRTFANKMGSDISLIEGSDSYNKYQVVAQIFRTINNRYITEDELESFFRIDGYLKNALVDYKTFSRTFHEKFSKFEEVSRAYSEFKEKHQLIDFDDMLVRTLQIFESDEEILRSLQRRYEYLQLDEAQDTSLIQLRIIQKIAEPENNLFMVADDDQAIYGFRGANPSYLLQFKEIYPQAKVILMEDNYRSSRNIVELSAHFIQTNKSRYEKIPQTTDQEESRIQIIIAKSLKAQLKKITDELPADIENGSVALLFRNNLSMISLMDELDKQNIPFSARARGQTFYQHPVLRDIQDILQFAREPSDLTLFRKIYYKLNSFLKRSFIDEIGEMSSYASVFDRLRQLEGTRNSFYREKIDHLEDSFALIQKQTKLAAAIDIITSTLGYGDYLIEKARRESTAVNSNQRVVETLKMISRDLSTPESLDRRVAELQELEKTTANRDGIILSTIHGSKGLEYDTVWVLDLIQQEFPSTTALEMAEAGDSYLLEEERRLFYVAMTRAKKRLKLFGRKSVNGKACQYSQFLTELTKKRQK